jgi:hypothetical protein
MKFGGFQSDFGVVSLFLADINKMIFFDGVNSITQAHLLKHGGYCLRAIGLLEMSERALDIAQKIYRTKQEMRDYAISLGLLCSVRIFMGKLHEGLQAAETQGNLDNSKVDWLQFATNTRLAEIKSHILPISESRLFYKIAFTNLGSPHKSHDSAVKALYSQACSAHDKKAQSSIIGSITRWIDYCVETGDSHEVRRWSALMKTLMDTEPKFNSIVHLSLLKLFDAKTTLMGSTSPEKLSDKINANLTYALDGLQSTGQRHLVPYKLLTRALYRYLKGSFTGPDSAQTDLDEAWDIAERGPMRLHMADIHLYRARLFFREAHYPWESPEADLKAARALIDRCGYGRRREELEDAETALAQWRQNHPAPT